MKYATQPFQNEDNFIYPLINNNIDQNQGVTFKINNNYNYTNTLNPKITTNEFNNITQQPLNQTFKSKNSMNNNSNLKPFNADEYFNNLQNKKKMSQLTNDNRVSEDEKFLMREKEYLRQSSQSFNNNINFKNEYNKQLNEHMKQINFSGSNFNDNDNLISTSKI